MFFEHSSEVFLQRIYPLRRSVLKALKRGNRLRDEHKNPGMRRGFWNLLDLQTFWMKVSTKIEWLKLYDHFAVATNFNFNGVG